MNRIKFIMCCFIFMLIPVCVLNAQTLHSENIQQDSTIKTAISKSLDAWHKAASEANFNAYFNLMTCDAVFVGTDASEHWDIQAFKAYSKPHFDAGKAWSFTALERHIYVSEPSKLAWFDELLKTQMGVCRGSGVMEYVKGTWKIAHYVLSATIPNPDMKAVTTLKATADSNIEKSFKQ
ncbi:nuclear transport factor 2 family protein [Formosa haliotis]|uniref:nuclear transport factor 2 family protein n=1 Tax=Formosa haliotis TaxID=1555194 RepID=UPI001F38BEC2|nr:nuclear transport factor 2 family protein [Formosa haliotis]